MTVELLDYVAPNGVEVLLNWLAPLGECRTERPTGAVLPFMMVQRAGGGDDEFGFTDEGRYAIHVFHDDESAAMTFCDTVDRRVKVLSSRFAGQRYVTISTGDVAVDDVQTFEAFRPEEYFDDKLPKTIYRFTAIYEMDLRYVAA